MGSVSGLAAAILAVTFVQLQWNAILALAAAIVAGMLVGLYPINFLGFVGESGSWSESSH